MIVPDSTEPAHWRSVCLSGSGTRNMYLSWRVKNGLILGGAALLSAAAILAWTHRSTTPSYASVNPAPVSAAAGCTANAYGEPVGDCGTDSRAPSQSYAASTPVQGGCGVVCGASPFAASEPQPVAQAYLPPPGPVPVAMSQPYYRTYYYRGRRRRVVVVRRHRSHHRTAKYVAGGAIGGAAIGAIAGGGKGAGIGAIAGGAGGYVVSKLTRK